MNQLFAGLMYHSTSQACVADFTPPTFLGIATLTPQLNGALTATWLAASDISTPIRYEVYIQAGSSTGLFSLSNISLITPNLSSAIFSLADSTLLQESTIYYVGVRAVDAIGNRDSNIVSISAVSLGVPEDSVASLLNVVQQVVGIAAQEIIGLVDDDSDILGLLDEDFELIGILEDC